LVPPAAAVVAVAVVPLVTCQAREMVMMAVRSHFRPEFINRVDEFIMFDPLEQDQIKAIVRLQVGSLKEER
jgi:ATP-dependent Clp protease ATP-binding subunit ClpA